jgi:outer membrane protein OmpA-like peptidoglycan-associated protein
MPLKIIYIISFLLTFCNNYFTQGKKTLSIYYGSNEYLLSKNQQKSIDSLLNENAFESITLIGFADTVGNKTANLKISQNRANQIESYILGKISSVKISTIANGENHQQKKQSNLKNQRRVDIILNLTSIESIEETQIKLKVVNPTTDSTKLIKPTITPKDKFSTQLMKEDRIIVENLLFEPGKTIFLYNKIPNELYYLAELMDENPVMRIKIEGHVCCVDDKKLSTERAKSVYLFLRAAGIDKSRMEYEGYSNTKPLVEERTAADQQRNRRVEILILEK